jgi:DNA invertase Pin-like site-specific DNA recombinase
MFQMMGVFAEFERAMIRERLLAGLARAKEQGISLGRRRLEDSDAVRVAAIILFCLSRRQCNAKPPPIEEQCSTRRDSVRRPTRPEDSSRGKKAPMQNSERDL